jgi:hypothetical protein
LYSRLGQRALCSPSTTNLDSSELLCYTKRGPASSAGARHGARSAGFANARAPGYSRAQFYESASDEDVDVAGASAKHTPMDNSFMEYFPVDPEGQPLDPKATQINTIS